MSYEDIQRSDKVEHLAEPIERDDYKIYFHSCEDMGEIPDNTIHFHFTSPPYATMRGTVLFDSYQHYLQVMYNVFCEMFRTLSPGRAMGINISDYQVSEELDEEIIEGTEFELGQRIDIPSHLSYLLYKLNQEYAEHHELRYEDTFTWVKPGSTSHRAGTFIDSGFPLKYRPNQIAEQIMIFRKGDLDYRRIWREKQRDDAYSKYNLSTYESFEREFAVDPENYRDFLTDVWEIQPETQSDHPAPFPVELPQRFIELYTLPHEIVCDPFLGSATTIVAAQRVAQQRRAVGYENFDAESEETPNFEEMIRGRLSTDSAALDSFL